MKNETDFRLAFKEHDFTVLDEGKIVKNTPVRLQHICGHTRLNPISYQKAQYKKFLICQCHGFKERRAFRTNAEIISKLKKHNLEPCYPLETIMPVTSKLPLKCCECGHRRELPIGKISSNKLTDCPVCSGNKLTAKKVQERLAPFGIRLKDLTKFESGETLVEFECANGHVYTSTFFLQRERGCRECARPQGERLLLAMCRILWPEGEWISEYRIVGLGEDNDASYRYDIASEVLKVVIENHSPLHEDPEHKFYRERSVENDSVKRNAIINDPRFKDWRYVVVRWSQEDLPALLAASNASSISEILFLDLKEAFRNQFLGQGVKPIPFPRRAAPSSDEWLQHHSDLRIHIQKALDNCLTFLPDQAYLGENKSYYYKCENCDFVQKRPAKTILQNDNPCSSCGSHMNWEGFIHMISAAGYKVLDADLPRTYNGIIKILCKKHKNVKKMTRDTAANHARREPKKLCSSCANDLPKTINRWANGPDKLKDHRARLLENGWRLIDEDWHGTSIAGGGSETYEVECVSCGDKKAIGLHQNKDKYGCRNCDKLKKIEELKTSIIPYDLSFDPKDYIRAREKVTFNCSKLGCPHNGYYASSPDNMKRKGPACGICRSKK
ncbi:hypothetical protein [Donghicola eburneus]|uniref:Zinc-ribbon domain-containing protein n=1 Tax=Donghicola eburneus TaxID=393278 RepID=A0A1M4N2W4_9RHOB|nr:hypothetical protein [Donghicola eburneus]SCM68324.1 hypothetical protein KARMA_2541 [Donghicola eburneus]